MEACYRAKQLRHVTQLKTLASTCEFAEQENVLIRDRIVLRIKDSGLQERLLRENNLNVEKAIEIVRAAEASREQIRNDIISRLEGKKIFTVVDLKDGFWDVPIDEVSSEICTCNTPFGRYKFNKMPFGIVSASESDYKPLMATGKKPMHKIFSRKQRMILKLLKYDFEINYVPGNQMFLADTLSRAFPVSETVRDDPEMLNIVHTISKHLPMSEKRREQFKKETELDPELQIVVK
ncbi:transposon Tf2-9 polyprotein [Trichonephila clavipes]|nr:transposon Tf2-9 polyprotein [Trichonephila clavipes]